MKDWDTKKDNTTSSKSILYASDVNSKHNECRNVVLPFNELMENDNKQLVKSIYSFSKSLTYTDISPTVNQVKLVRSVISEHLETLIDGVTVFFSPATTNTGSTTMQLGGATPVPCRYKGNLLSANFLIPEVRYVATYNAQDICFDISNITPFGANAVPESNPNETFKVANGIHSNEAISMSQLTGKVKTSDIVNNLTTNDSHRPLSANQAHILKGLIDTIQETLSSDKSNLDTMQEVVDYIKANHNNLTGFSIGEINGLQSALDNKSSSSHSHNNLYYAKPVVTSKANAKIYKYGDASAVFNVKAGTGRSAVTHQQWIDTPAKSTGWKYTYTHNPATNTNPPYDYACCKNASTGEFFVCKDRTKNHNVWRGSQGTTIQ